MDDLNSWILVAVILFLLGYLVILYNNLVNLKHAVAKHLANIDVLLKQRHDELPKLVETCRRYMAHERETLTQITEARSRVAEAQSQGDIPALGLAETALRAGLGRLFAVVENYPELKADKTFAHLQQRISGLENSIADRREVYNEAVNNNNVRIEQFPDLLVARLFGFKPFDLLEFREAELADTDLKQLFGS
jgi:LemA protein